MMGVMEKNILMAVGIVVIVAVSFVFHARIKSVVRASLLAALAATLIGLVVGHLFYPFPDLKRVMLFAGPAFISAFLLSCLVGALPLRLWRRSD